MDTKLVERVVKEIDAAREEVAAERSEIEKRLAELEAEDARLREAASVLSSNGSAPAAALAKPVVLRPKGKSTTPNRVPLTARDTTLVLNTLRNAGKPLARRELLDLTGFFEPQLRKALSQLVSAGSVKQVGERGGARYQVEEDVAGAPKQSPTDEGRVLSALMGRKRTPAEVSVDLGIPLGKVRSMLSVMVAEGDVLMYKGDQYTAKP